MERCYVCTSCGKCAESAHVVEAAGPRCLDCGREVRPGEKLTECAGCGSRNIAFGGPSAAPAR